MRFTFTGVLWPLGLLVAALAAFGCDTTPTYSPYIEETGFELNGRCWPYAAENGDTVYDCGCEASFILAKGSYVNMEVPAAFAPACESRLYLHPKGNSIEITHYNTIMPCFPDNIVGHLLNEDGDVDDGELATYLARFEANFTSASTNGVPVIASSIQMKEEIRPFSLLAPEMCSYTLRAKIDDVEKGEYEIKLWDRYDEPLFFLDKDGEPTISTWPVDI